MSETPPEPYTDDRLSAIAAAVTAEREACAMTCEMLLVAYHQHHLDLPPPYPRAYFMAAARAIRARHQEPHADTLPGSKEPRAPAEMARPDDKGPFP